MSAENEWPIDRVHRSVVLTFATVILYLEQAPLYSCGPSYCILPPVTLEFGLPRLL